MADDPTIRWTVASPFGILRDEAEEAWNSGRVNDILELDTGGLVVATDSGGVWMVDEDNNALPLSDSWAVPDIYCLAFGPDGSRHIYAGCDGGIIRETDPSATIPMLSWRQVDAPLPAEAGRVNRIVIIPRLRRIVAACNGGLYWATIPDFSTPRPPYVWQTARVSVPQGFWDVAVAATRSDHRRPELEDRRVITIVAGGYDSSSWAPINEMGGVFVGQWNEEDGSVMERSRIHNDDGTDASGLYSLMGACSVSSHERRPNVVYAACSSPTGKLYLVLRSHDGGQSWGICKTDVTNQNDSLFNLAGDQGNTWNNCIAVSPDNPGLVALGWVSLFLSFDAGGTWRQVLDDDKHLHEDRHALRFSNPPDRTGDLYVGSDGGVARINLDDFPDPVANRFRSNYNRGLPTLQCYDLATGDTGFRGTLGLSMTEPGLIAAGLQDNGDVHCFLRKPVQAWVDLDRGDGGWNTFTSDGTYLHNTMHGPVAATMLDRVNGVISHGIVPVTQSPLSEGLFQPVGEPVLRPTYGHAAGKILQAVAAVQNQLFGLYMDEINDPRHYWELIAAIPSGQEVTALASYHGGSTFVGTRSGKMYVVDTRLKSVLELPVILPKPNHFAEVTGGAIHRIALFGESDAFALMNSAKATWPSRDPVTLRPSTKTIKSFPVLRLNILKWEVTAGVGLPNETKHGLEAVALANSEVSRALFVSTDKDVYISRDNGGSWVSASQGLPETPHCRDLRFARFDTEAHLYLSTWGRSVWAAQLR